MRDGMDELIDGWLARFGSEHTRAAYRNDVAQFTAWCDSIGGQPLAADTRAIRWFRRSHERSGVSEATLARRMSALNGFFRFAVESGAIVDHPFGDRTRPVPPNSTTVALSDGERELLLDALPSQPLATQVLVAVLLLDGLKLDEVLRLDRRDISRKPPLMVASVRRGDGGRAVTLHPGSVAIITAVLRRRAKGPLLTDDSASDRLGRSAAGYLVRKAGREAGLEMPLTSNVLRRTFVSHAHRSGRSIDEIRRQVGHDDARTTRRYLDRPR